MDRTKVWLDFYIRDGGNTCFLPLISLSVKSWDLHWAGPPWRWMATLSVLFTAHGTCIVTFNHHYLLIGSIKVLCNKMARISSSESFSRKVLHTSIFIDLQVSFQYLFLLLTFLKSRLCICSSFWALEALASWTPFFSLLIQLALDSENSSFTNSS